MRRLLAALISVSLLLVAFLLLFVSHVQAAETRNVFGIHISDKDDIPRAATLVNGEQGAWGYVTLVMQSDDRKIDKWQPIFYDLMKYRLQPIVRLATKVEGSNWARPTDQDAMEWAEFLSTLYWPTDQHIVSIYNEMNHGSEWGGAVDPASYAKVLEQTIKTLREKDSHIFILQGAFDQSTPQQPPAFMDQERFMEGMQAAVPGIFSQIDGWASHSYPNPGFAGKPTDRGRKTVRGYEWELELLRTKFGVTKQLPVYIKETGWPYSVESKKLSVSVNEAAEYIQQAFTDVWLKDERVVAVTPFMLRAKGDDFRHFSWLTMADQPTVMYDSIAALPKLKGSPKISFDARVATIDIPSSVPLDREIPATITYQNIGSSPWRAVDALSLGVEDPAGMIVRHNFYYDDPDRDVMPGQSYIYRFQLRARAESKSLSLALQPRAESTMFGEKLYVPIQVYGVPQFVLHTTPLITEVEQVQVGIRNQDNYQKVFDAVTLPMNGDLGTYEDPLFKPNQPVQVVIAAPRREKVILTVRAKEGINEVEFVLPPEKNAMQLFAENVARVLRRS